MREPLTIAVAQPPCVPGGVAANAGTHAATVREAGARVVVFPEMSLTGYELDAPALSVDDPALAPIVEACEATGALALAGAPVEGAAGRTHIAMLAIDGSGVTVVYHKLWLTAKESHRFTPGRKPHALDVDGWRLGLAICRDTGMPQQAKDTAALGIDAYLAGTLMSPQAAAQQDERGHRIAADHNLWVAVASFAGPTGNYPATAGRSAIWQPGGTMLSQAGPDTGAIAHATLK